MIFIDRFEDEFAVLEVGENQFRRVARSLLPADAKEGSVLRWENGSYTHDPAAQQQRKEQLMRLQQKVFAKKKGETSE